MSRRILRLTVLVTVSVALLAGAQRLGADVTLPSIFRDDMMLQRDVLVSVWGTADAGERVTVTLGKQRPTAVADAAGKWTVKLAPLKAGDPSR